jgi:hypothetical protein
MYVQLKCAEILMNVGAPFDVQRRALHCIMLLDMVGKICSSKTLLLCNLS